MEYYEFSFRVPESNSIFLQLIERLYKHDQINQIAKPIGMGEPEFQQRVQQVVDWFAALNPYNFGGSILKVEDVNLSLWTPTDSSLYSAGRFPPNGTRSSISAPMAV